MAPSDIDSEHLQHIQRMLKATLGVDDINKIVNPDSRFSSPENTWSLYKKALIDGDITLVLKCLIQDKAKHNRIYEKMGKEYMKERALSMREIERISGDEKNAIYMILREFDGNDIAFEIYFVNVFGEWKIERF